jgi:transcriptional regulator with XRE-family HTH domain
MSGMADGFEAGFRRLATHIRARRLDLDLSQEFVAGEVGLSARHYQQIESGDANPNFRSLWLIARALDTPLAALLDGKKPKKPKREQATRRSATIVVRRKRKPKLG